MKHRIVHAPAMHVVGLGDSFTPATIPTIPALWARFVPRIGEIAGRKGSATYGLCRANLPDGQGGLRFEYTAAVEVERPAAPPKGFVAFTVPATTYAVFTHEGHNSKIGATFDAIHGGALAAAGLTQTEGYEFERYDERWDARTGTGPVDIFVPVVAPAR
jgi:AraC family transcriptional regulator